MSLFIYTEAVSSTIRKPIVFKTYEEAYSHMMNKLIQKVYPEERDALQYAFENNIKCEDIPKDGYKTYTFTGNSAYATVNNSSDPDYCGVWNARIDEVEI